MSTQIGTHGLSCIGDDDYAAYALSMQCNAQNTDAALAADSAALTTAQTRPWIVATNLNAITVSSSSGTIGPRGLVGEVLRTSSSGSVFVQASGMPTAFVLSDPDSFMPQGIYQIGATIRWTLAAATNDTIRQLMVYGIPLINGSLSTPANYTDLYQNEDYQNDGGNTGSLTVAGLLDTRAGDMAYVESFFTHANVAGDLTIPAGAWRVWATYLGSGLTI